jgi:hypothetical protein
MAPFIEAATPKIVPAQVERTYDRLWPRSVLIEMRDAGDVVIVKAELAHCRDVDGTLEAASGRAGIVKIEGDVKSNEKLAALRTIVLELIGEQGSSEVVKRV